MLRIADLLLESGISRRDLAEATGINRDQFTRTFVREIFPVKRARFVSSIESFIQSNPKCLAWLQARRFTLDAIWEPIGAAPLARRYPVSHGRKVHAHKPPALVPGNPQSIDQKEGVMLTQKTLKHFRLFRSPFLGEIGSERDIYLGEEHIFLREMMMETSRNAGFTAISGECGCGKSMMRKVVAGRLAAEGIKVIFPVIVDKARITPSSLIDAIIMDISEETPKRSLEAKTRQAFRLLKNRAASGLTQVLMIEEAHLLSVKAIKCLKQIHELEDGYKKMLGIILLGQPELKYLLDEAMHPELREVIRRVTIAEITDLGSEVTAYLKHKFDRAAAGRYAEIFTDDAIDAVLKRLPKKAYPLSVNNLVARAMNLAAQMGETGVTAEIVMTA